MVAFCIDARKLYIKIWICLIHYQIVVVIAMFVIAVFMCSFIKKTQTIPTWQSLP